MTTISDLPERWQQARNQLAMLSVLRAGLSDRKAWLLSCGWCRQVPHLLHDDRLIELLAVTERFADGQATADELDAAYQAAAEAADDEPEIEGSPIMAAVLSTGCFSPDPREVCHQLGRAVLEQASGPGAVCFAAQAALLRHFVGNPYRPYPAPDCWPCTVVQLADAVYTGQDCGFALHDALLEAGHADLAAHFRQEQQHPKGCWAVDLVLGKS